MRSNTTMNVNLSRDLHKFVKSAVQSGRYTSASEVVREALRDKRNEALRQVERKIEAGLASARRGEALDGEVVMRELRGLGARRTRSAGNASQ